MKKYVIFLLFLAELLVLGNTEIFFGGKFIVYYNEDYYSFEWLKEYVSNLRLLHGLGTEDRFVLDLKRAIDRASAETGLDPLLIIAVITVETEFRNVIGMAGELGLMQIKPETAEFVAMKFDLPKPKNGNWKILLWDYELNILYGSYYLKYLLDRFKSLRLALEYYNAGTWRKEYAAKILELYNQLKSGS